MTTNTENIIDMDIGNNSKSSLVRAGKILKRAFSELIDFEIENDAPRLVYLEDEDDRKMLISLAKFLSNQYEDEVSDMDLLFTNGASSAFVYLWIHLLPRDRKVIVASPTYQLLLNSLIKDLKYEIESVPEDEDGLNLDMVENILKREYELHGSDKNFCCGIYLIPVFSNPTGILYSHKFNVRIMELVAKYNALVVCDDVYNLLYTSEHPPKRLLSYETNETKGHIVSNGSFSKYTTPSLRLGWIEAHSPLIDRINKWEMLESLNCLSQLSAMIVITAIDNGDMSKHFHTERLNMKSRFDFTRKFLEENLCKDVKFSKCLGGYFVWISLPENIRLEEVQKRCYENHVLILPGTSYTNTTNQNCFRLNIARVDDLDQLKEGLQIICSIIDSLNDKEVS